MSNEKNAANPVAVERLSQRTWRAVAAMPHKKETKPERSDTASNQPSVEPGLAATQMTARPCSPALNQEGARTDF